MNEDDDWRPSVIRGFVIGALMSGVLWILILWAIGII
jgi:hypothetical protein